MPRKSIFLPACPHFGFNYFRVLRSLNNYCRIPLYIKYRVRQRHSNLLNRNVNAETTRNEKEQSTNFSHLFKMFDFSFFFSFIFVFFYNTFIVVIHCSLIY